MSGKYDGSVIIWGFVLAAVFMVLNFFAQHIGMFVYKQLHHGPMPSVDSVKGGALYFFLGLAVVIVVPGLIAGLLLVIIGLRGQAKNKVKAD